MPDVRTPAQVFPLSEYLTDELNKRRWTAADVAARCHLPAGAVQCILDGDYMSLDAAESLGHALGVSPGLLLSLQLTWRKQQVDSDRGR